jgi:UDP-N-acetyl-2-amino-2-deoxyglucuronate dehydrogenase
VTERIRFGVVGCGSIGPTHMGALRQIGDADLVAVADIDVGRAESAAKKYDVARVYGSLDALLADPEIDAVCLCTPSGLHGEGAIRALEAGKHVVVEKPMEVSVEACDRMIAAEDATGRKLTVISQHRFDTATLLLKEALDQGKLGRIVLADASVKWWRTQAYYDSGDWRGTWAMDGGGALMNQGVHTVDLLQWLTGGVASLYAQIRTSAHDRIEVEDVAVAALTFECGAIGTLTATTAAWEGFPVRLEIYGTEGSAILEGDRLKQLTLKSGEAFAREEAAAHALSVARGGTASVKEEAATRLTADASADPGAVWGDAHRAQLEDFIRAIRTDGKPLIDGRAGRRPIEIVTGVYRSAQTGLPVTIL